MKRILVPTDFSDNAYNAALYAMELAREFDATVTLLNVYHIPTPLPGLPIEIIITPDELRSDTDSVLKQQRQKLLNSVSFPIKVECITRNGFSEQEINETAEYLDSDLIVMGMRGKGMVRKELLGSITTSVITKSKKPVLVVPRQIRYKPYDNILPAVDSSAKIALGGFPIVNELAEHFQSTLHFVTITHPHDTFDKDKFMEQFEGILKSGKYDFNFLASDFFYSAIEQFIVTNKIDLLVMFPHHHSFFGNLVRSHHTREMAFRGHIPLLAIPE